MIQYDQVLRGDILKITGAGAPGYAKLGDLVRVLEVHTNSVKVEDRDGKPADFMYNCGAERLEPTEWHEDFPKTEPCDGCNSSPVDCKGSDDCETLKA